MKMLRLSYTLALCSLFFNQNAWAETENDSDELDEEFLEILGSFESEDDDWYDFFWSTIDKTEQNDGTLDLENE